MIDFDRFWADDSDPDEDEISYAEVPPGVTPAEVDAWEQRHGVTLPEPLRTALSRRDGGTVRTTSVEILPLGTIVPVDADFWEWTEIDEEDAPDHALVLAFGSDSDVGGTYVLNFNAAGPDGSPSVYLDHHGEGSTLVSPSIEEFFEAELASDEAPAVDWSEAEGHASVIASETLDPSYDDGRAAFHDQVLVRQGDGLVLFTRDRSSDGESLTRTELPLPLDPDQVEVRALNPAPGSHFHLHLQPVNYDRVVSTMSERDEDGRWKNSTSEGGPINVSIMSPDPERLRAIVAKLFEPDVVAAIQARHDHREQVERSMSTMTPAQRSLAFFEAAMKIKVDVEAEHQPGDPTEMPTELAQAVEMMRRRTAQMAEMLRQKAGGASADPEMLRQIEKMLRPPGTE